MKSTMMSDFSNILPKSDFQSWIIFVLFLGCSAINIIGEGLHVDLLVFLSKPLLLLLLLLFFFKNTRNSRFPAVVNWIMFAILASSLGDILLLLAGRSSGEESLFLGGLGAFLMTHIAYAVAFHKLTPGSSFKYPLVLMVPMILFWLGFNYIFSASLSGILQPAVGLYSLVILVMIYFAWRLNDGINAVFSRWVWWGALLFLLSDTFIGLNKFGQDLVAIPAASVLIMVSYLTGQALIVLGLIQSLLSIEQRINYDFP